MLGLVTFKDLQYILGDEPPAGDTNTIPANTIPAFISTTVRKGVEVYKSRPGFFTPYKTMRINEELFSGQQQVAGELLAPLVYPLLSSTVAALGAFITAVSLLIAVGALFVAAGAALFSNRQLHDQALDCSSFAFQLVGLALIATVSCLLLTVISIPHSLVSLGTRSGATAVAALSDDKCGTTDPLNDDDSEYSPQAVEL